ncbi:T9SS type A sorting domain-containing protein [Candidatus Eisenbacteria bacterium]|uniref:T9SS type A sorting domain-containing protein n=1 Tax=Eiseniibacteriota bacterium TaxID=2212470 RepID=A0ABV6YJR1_UNCEI
MNFNLTTSPSTSLSDIMIFCFDDCEGTPLHFWADEIIWQQTTSDCDSQVMSSIEIEALAPETDPNGCIPYSLLVPDCISPCCELRYDIQAGECLFHVQLNLRSFDLTGDLQVDDEDAALWQVLAEQQDLCADFDFDGYWDFEDLMLLGLNNGQYCVLTDVVALEDVPAGLQVHSNVPNPFNPTTQVEFSLPIQCPVKVSVFNLMGRETKILLETEIPAGRHRLSWDGSSDSGERQPSGVYFLRVSCAAGSQTVRMTLLD